MLNCNFLPIEQFLCVASKREDNRTKEGKYLRSEFHHSEPGYLIGAYLEVDNLETLLLSESLEQIGERCIEFLNSKSRKYKKRVIYKYGQLTFIDATLKEKSVIQIRFLTTDKKNKRFWGTGRESLPGLKAMHSRRSK